VLTESGTELWAGEARRLSMLDGLHAMVRRESGVVDFIHLAEDQTLRKEVRLDVPNEDFRTYEYDRYDRRLVVSFSNRVWIDYDPITGKRLGTHENDMRKPSIPTWGTGSSRFSVQAARLVERYSSLPADPSGLWNPRDAWRVNSGLLVLDHHGQVHVSGRKRGTYMTIGSVDNAYRFGVLGNELGVAGYDENCVATFAAGPSLVPARFGNQQRLDYLPEGPWRVKNNFYMPPRSPSLIFDPAKCGFSPRILRSPPGSGSTSMLMVTDSLLFEVEANLGKALGIVDTQGLRDQDN
jgi:hypothetical protein